MKLISINLIPYRHRLKEITAIRTICIYLAIIFASAAAGGGWWGYLHTVNTELQAGNALAEKEIGELKKKIGEIESTKKLKEDAEKRLAVIDGLRWQRQSAALRFRAIANALPPKAWLTKYSESGTSVTIGGNSDCEETTAAFIGSLEASEEFVGVELISSELQVLPGGTVKHFELTTQIRRNETADKTAAADKQAAPKEAKK